MIRGRRTATEIKRDAKRLRKTFVLLLLDSSQSTSRYILLCPCCSTVANIHRALSVLSRYCCSTVSNVHRALSCHVPFVRQSLMFIAPFPVCPSCSTVVNVHRTLSCHVPPFRQSSTWNMQFTVMLLLFYRHHRLSVFLCARMTSL